MHAPTSAFQHELELWGPESIPQPVSLSEAKSYCRALCQRHYENFSVASWLLPRNLRQDFATIYAFCRWSDDLADEVGDSHTSLKLLEWWHCQLEDCFAGQRRLHHPVFIALHETIGKHAMGIEPFENLLAAFRQDQTTSRYATRRELLQYCQGSANPVGRLVLRMADADSSKNLVLSDSICTGLQLANFCQDMAIDASKGRIYCPTELWSAFNVTESMFLQSRHFPELSMLLQAWCDETRIHLNVGWDLAEQVPQWLSVDIELFIRGGLAILDSIRAHHYDVWTQRPILSKAKKMQLMVAAIWHSYIGKLGRFKRS